MFKTISNLVSSVSTGVQEAAHGTMMSLNMATGRKITPIEYGKVTVNEALSKSRDYVNATLFGSGYMRTVEDAEMAKLEKATAPNMA